MSSMDAVRFVIWLNTLSPELRDDWMAWNREMRDFCLGEGN